MKASPRPTLKFHGFIETPYAFTLVIVLMCAATACDRSFVIDGFQSTYTEGSTPSQDAKKVIVDYDRKTNTYTKASYDFKSPPNQIETEHNQLLPDQQRSLSDFLSALDIDSYKEEYTEFAPARESDASPVDSTFRHGDHTKRINMDTADTSTLPAALLNFVDSIRYNKYF